MDYEDVMLSKRSQQQKGKHYMIPFIWDIQSSQTHEDRKCNGICQGPKGAGNREVLFNEYRISVLPDEKSSEDWLHDNMNVLHTTELHMLKWLRRYLLFYIYFIIKTIVMTKRKSAMTIVQRLH